MILKFCDLCGKPLSKGPSYGYFNKNLGSFDFCDECYDELPADNELLNTILSKRSYDLLREKIKNNVDLAELTNATYVKKEEFDVFGEHI